MCLIAGGLVLDHAIARPCFAGKAQQQAGFQLVNHLLRDAQRVDDCALGFEFNEVEAAKDARVLILQPSPQSEVLTLDLPGERGHLVVVQVLVEEPAEHSNQAHHQAGGASKPRSGRRRGAEDEVESALRPSSGKPPDGRLHQVQFSIQLELLVSSEMARNVQVQGVNRYRTVLTLLKGAVCVTVDGRVEHHSPFALGKRRHVGATAGEGDAQRRLGADRPSASSVRGISHEQWAL